MVADPVDPVAHHPRTGVIARVSLALAAGAFGIFYLMLAFGAASFIHECNGLLCGQLHQAVFAGIAGAALFVAAYRVLSRMPSAAAIAFYGTLPILIVHVILVLTDPNESIFFPLSTTPPPVISGAILFLRRISGRTESRGRG